MSTKITWKNQQLPVNLYFKDVPVGTSFRNKFGRGAVYQKVVLEKSVSGREIEAMLELATGRVFPATASQIEEVQVEVQVGVVKPNIY